ncbi:MAG TPA: hypothetical protein VLV83_09740, partial [Acidobacteriota bacterium]|nr:hypothetical protein [Acidobacteriota bacterium]
LDLSKVYQNTTLINTVGPIPDDTSADVLRDDDPQSGGSTGRVYDLDAPAFSVPGSEVGSIRRRRDNFTQWAAFDGMRASSDFHWFFRMSLIETTSGEILHNDVSSDNRLGVGITKQTWNLQ